ncbi:hypothetical protein Tco_0770218 [Tanacetum coccineum]|uniref:Uncharacterized protein n=1 Tax=Tanacetum coccineum TaxID=301880 RepID=A0ABQ4ZF49_9ASTR
MERGAGGGGGVVEGVVGYTGGGGRGEGCGGGGIKGEVGSVGVEEEGWGELGGRVGEGGVGEEGEGGCWGVDAWGGVKSGGGGSGDSRPGVAESVVCVWSEYGCMWGGVVGWWGRVGGVWGGGGMVVGWEWLGDGFIKRRGAAWLEVSAGRLRLRPQAHPWDLEARMVGSCTLEMLPIFSLDSGFFVLV